MGWLAGSSTKALPEKKGRGGWKTSGSPGPKKEISLGSDGNPKEQVQQEQTKTAGTSRVTLATNEAAHQSACQASTPKRSFLGSWRRGEPPPRRHALALADAMRPLSGGQSGQHPLQCLLIDSATTDRLALVGCLVRNGVLVTRWRPRCMSTARPPRDRHAGVTVRDATSFSSRSSLSAFSTQYVQIQSHRSVATRARIRHCRWSPKYEK